MPTSVTKLMSFTLKGPTVGISWFLSQGPTDMAPKKTDQYGKVWSGNATHCHETCLMTKAKPMLEGRYHVFFTCSVLMLNFQGSLFPPKLPDPNWKGFQVSSQKSLHILRDFPVDWILPASSTFTTGPGTSVSFPVTDGVHVNKSPDPHCFPTSECMSTALWQRVLPHWWQKKSHPHCMSSSPEHEAMRMPW